jgi:hypothetical protein
MSTDHGTILTPDHPFVGRVLGALRATYGSDLRAVALFGSVARRTARADSDVDLLVVVDRLPHGRRRRLETLLPVEQALAPDLARLEKEGITTEISAVLRTPGEVETPTPLLLDLTEDAVVLYDPDSILASALDGLRGRLARLGARRIWRGARWYWDLKPDYRRGEIIRL